MERSLSGRLGRSWDRSPRVQAGRLLTSTSRPLAACLVIDTILQASLPILVLVGLGRLIEGIPGVVNDGFGSPAGDRLTLALVLVGLALLAAMLASPFHDWLGTVIKARLSQAMQFRLMKSVSNPAGIAHLEDPAVLDRVALARGSLMTVFPADAPGFLAAVLGRRLTWLVGCIIVGTFRWWLGVVLIVVWQVVRRPMMRTIKEHVAAFGGNAAVMRRAEYFRMLATTPAAAKEVRVFGLGDWVVERYRQHWSDAMSHVWRIRARTGVTTAWVGAVLLLVYVGACAVIADAALDGDLALGEVAVLLPMLFTTMTGGTVGFDDISLQWQLSALPELSELEADLSSKRGGLSRSADPGARPTRRISFEDVSFQYPGAHDHVLDGLSLTIPAGRSTAIVGVNGAGKTTLVKLLARLHDPTGGRITVDGRPLTDFDAAAWQRKVAVVFQDFARLPFTARENIGLGAPEHLSDEPGILAAAGLAGARDLVEALPRGWDTPLSRQLSGGIDLSSGQWQRIALARALFATRHGASLLVLDEPTSWLDVRGEAAFFERFLDITRNLTTVVISHRFSTVRLADQICVLRNGKVVEIGSHAELLDLNGLYARMFRLQAARFAEDRDSAA